MLFWQMLLSDNVILLSLSRLIIDQFVAVGSQYGIATFTISPHFDVVENLGLVCIVSVWTWTGLDVCQYFSVATVYMFVCFSCSFCY